MDRGSILLVTTLVVLVAPGVKGTSHSSASNVQLNITDYGCDVTKPCFETPQDCDPAGASNNCLFVTMAGSDLANPSGSTVSFQVRGNTVGYVAVGVTADVSKGTSMLFICSQNISDNGRFFFRTMERDNVNGALSPKEANVTGVHGSVNSANYIIRCEFSVHNVLRSFYLLLGTGGFDRNTFGPFKIGLTTPLIKTEEPITAVPTAPPAPPPVTEAPPPVTAAPPHVTAAPKPSNNTSNVLHPHALLLLLSVLTLFVRQRD